MEKDYFSGPDLGLEVPDISVAEYFIPIFKCHPKGNIIQVDAVSDYEETSEELLEKSLKVSEGYLKFGFTQDDVFCLLARNSSDVYSAVLGVYWFGGILAPLDIDWNILELEVIFKKIKPTVIICEGRVVEKVSSILRKMAREAKIIVLAEKKKVKADHIAYEELLKTEVAENYVPRPVESPSTKLALILPTSGSTGVSKGVGLTHQNIISLAISFGKMESIGRCKGFLVVSHFFWISCTYSLMISLYYGMKRIYMTDVNPRNILNAIRKYKPETTLMSPPAFYQLIRQPDIHTYDLSNFKLIMLAGSPITQPIIDSAKKIWKDKLPLLNVYGTTEVMGLILRGEIGNNLLCSGKPNYNIKLKIVDPDTGKTLGPYEKGELCAKTPCIMRGYVGDDEETKAVLIDGWFHTGDIAYYEETGNFYIVDRLKEMIKDRGRQIAPSEIEAVIESVPGVEEAGVVGIEKDPDRTDLIGFVVKNTGSGVTQKTINNAIKENLAEYKQLKDVKFVEQLPRTNTGKLRRKILREMAASSYK